MLVRVYAMCVLLWDVSWVVLGSALAIIEACYHLLWPPQQKPVAGEIALVVGAGKGIGREFAKQLAALGAEVVCWDTDEESNQETVKAIKEDSGKAHGFTINCANKQEVEKAAAVVRARVGDVTILLHSYGIPSPNTVLTTSSDVIRSTIDSGIMSHFWMVQSFLPRMRELNHGHVVALSSVSGLAGLKSQGATYASQFAVQGMVEALSEELRVTKAGNKVVVSVVHIYPLVVGSEQSPNIELKIPSYFGKIDPKDAAKRVIEGMRRDYTVISIPWFIYYLGRFIRILPYKASLMIQNLFNTGADYD